MNKSYSVEAASAVEVMKAVNGQIARESREGYVPAVLHVRSVHVNGVASDKHLADVEFVKLLPKPKTA